MGRAHLLSFTVDLVPVGSQESTPQSTPGLSHSNHGTNTVSQLPYIYIRSPSSCTANSTSLASISPHLLTKTKTSSADCEHAQTFPRTCGFYLSNTRFCMVGWASAGCGMRAAGCEIRDDRPSGQMMNLRFLHDIYFRQLQWPAPDPPRALTSVLVLPGHAGFWYASSFASWMRQPT